MFTYVPQSHYIDTVQYIRCSILRIKLLYMATKHIVRLLKEAEL